MKSKFRGYYKLTPAEIKKIWSDGFISFDTNVLLNFYRYSITTTDKYINAIKENQEKIWIPYQVAKEFHDKRISVISGQIKLFDETIKSINKLEDEIYKKHPHLTKIATSKINRNLKSIIVDFERRNDNLDKLLQNDNILERITNLFDKKIGNPYDNKRFDKLKKEGEERIKKSIPPGYKDKDKDGDNKFGDLIIWNQLIDRAKEKKKSFIFVCDDRKEDWWLEAHGKTISPRPELLQELFKESGMLFHMYRPDKFIEYANEINIKKVDKQTIKEVKDFQDEKSNMQVYGIGTFNPQFGIKNAFSSFDFYKNMLEEHEVDSIPSNCPNCGSSFSFLEIKNKEIDFVVNTKQLFSCFICGYKIKINKPLGLTFNLPVNKPSL